MYTNRIKQSYAFFSHYVPNNSEIVLKASFEIGKISKMDYFCKIESAKEAEQQKLKN
jgi:hypothetical protein